MTRKAQKKSPRKFTAVAAAVVASVGLASSYFFHHHTLNDLSLGSISVVAATSDSLTLTSPLALPLMPNVMIESGRLSVTGPNPKRKLTGSETMALLAAGKAKLVLDDAVLSLVPMQSAGVGGEKNTASIAPVLAALIKISFSQLQLRNAIVQLGRDEDEQSFLSDVSLEATKLDSKQVKATGTFDFRGERVAFDIVMGIEAELQNKASDGAGSIGRAFDIKLTSDLIAIKAAGTLSAGDQPQLSSKSSTLTVPDLRKLARWIGLELGSGGGLGKFEARGPLEFSPSAIAFSDATFRLDGSEATGALNFKWGGPNRPAIDGTLAFNSFDVAPFIAPSEAARKNASLPTKISDYFSLSPTQSSALQLAEQIDADLRISAANVSAGTIRFGRGAASLSLKDGVLLADLAELEMAKGARCGGQFGLQLVAGIPIYSLRGKVESIDLAVLSNALWSYNVLSGAGDVTVDLKANGREAEQMIATMNGKAGVRQPGNGQIGLDLRTLAATARAQAQNGWGGATRGQTAIQGLQADFTMVNGRLIAEQVSARAGDAILSAQGSVNFGSKSGDMQIWITHPKSSDAQSESDPNSVKPNSASGANSAAGSETSAAQKTGQSPGGSLQIHGPLDTPEIQFIPLGPAPTGNADDPHHKPRAPATSAEKG